MDQYYRAGFFKDSPVSDINVRSNVPAFACEVCGARSIVNYYNYPHLDVETVLDKRELRRLGPVIQERSTDQEILEIVSRLRDRFGVPVSAGTIFGPTRLKVTSRPKSDILVLIQHAGLFCRKSALDRLRASGIEIQSVESPAHGKWAIEAGFQELVVPVRNHQKLPPTVTFCQRCFRHTSEYSFPTVLIKPPEPNENPAFFKTVEDGIIVFSRPFLEAAKELNVTGLVEGKTVLPIQVVQ